MIPVYSSEEEERIRLNEKPRAKKASRRYVANPESNQLKLECLAICIALLCEYIPNKIQIAGFKQRVSGAFALYGWRYTLRNPIGNVKTIMDDDVNFKYTKTSTLRRARALFKRLQGMVKETDVSPWDLEAWPRETCTEESCNQLLQRYHAICIDIA